MGVTRVGASVLLCAWVLCGIGVLATRTGAVVWLIGGVLVGVVTAVLPVIELGVQA